MPVTNPDPAPPVGAGFEVSRPEFDTVEVVGEQTKVAEEHVDTFAIGDRRCRRERVLWMNTSRRYALVCRSPPQQLSRIKIKTNYYPVVGSRRRIRRGI